MAIQESSMGAPGGASRARERESARHAQKSGKASATPLRRRTGRRCSGGRNLGPAPSKKAKKEAPALPGRLWFLWGGGLRTGPQSGKARRQRASLGGRRSVLGARRSFRVAPGPTPLLLGCSALAPACPVALSKKTQRPRSCWRGPSFVSSSNRSRWRAPAGALRAVSKSNEPKFCYASRCRFRRLPHPAPGPAGLQCVPRAFRRSFAGTPAPARVIYLRAEGVGRQSWRRCPHCPKEARPFCAGRRRRVDAWRGRPALGLGVINRPARPPEARSKCGPPSSCPARAPG
ncbi:unnamed protein product [Amoebophrya sp. A120]|nr:unnamed protein product [Amoebophrya sp. A120]|eukprot:GSA120T00015835001.1